MKLGMSNGCDDSRTIAWWKLENGRTVGIWLEPLRYTDLWKAELAPVPVKTSNGRVHLTTDVMLGTAPQDVLRPDPKDRPFYYNGLAGENHVVCYAGPKRKCP